ncbi:MAG: ROK family protein [archaeon]
MRIGIDIGGTKIKAGLVEGNKVIKKIEIDTNGNGGKQEVLQNITKAIQTLMNDKVKEIGVGFPGPVDKNGVVQKSPHFDMVGENIKKHIEQKFKKKVLVDNDTNCMTIAEARYGVGKGHKNFVMISIGTNIGGAIIADGKLYRGRWHAGEVGHMTINYDGVKSRCCNNYGCFGHYVSIEGLQENYGKEILPEEIAELAMKGDKKAKEAYEQLGRRLGIGLMNLANILDPEVIIVGGGIAKSWKLFEKEMKKIMEERGFIKTKVVKAELRDGGIIGATLLFD